MKNLSEPRTEAGRDLLKVLSFAGRRRWGVTVWLDSVLRIEAAAREETLLELRQKVEALDTHNFPRPGDGYAFREAVLALLATLSEASDDRT